MATSKPNSFMNERSSHERPRFPLEKEHKATNSYYRRAILKAIEELHDFQSRSNIDAIRRHAQASLELDIHWNDTIFLKTLKATIQDGDVEQQTSFAGLSADFKRKRANSLTAVKERNDKMQSEELFFGPEEAPSPPPSIISHHVEYDHDVPHRKSEHFKPKITPRKLQTTRVLINPMDTF